MTRQWWFKVVLVPGFAVLTWTGGPASGAHIAPDGVCLPPGMPELATLRPVLIRPLDVRVGTSGRTRKVDQELMSDRTTGHRFLLSWLPETPKTILVAVDDDPDGPTMAWVDAGAGNPEDGTLREAPTQACNWERSRERQPERGQQRERERERQT